MRAVILAAGEEAEFVRILQNKALIKLLGLSLLSAAFFSAGMRH